LHPPPTSQVSPPAPSPSSPNRAPAPRIADMPPSAFRINREGSVRLSPSIINRPAQMPLLNLPKIPKPSSDPPPLPPKSQARLRSMPSLSVDGTNDFNRVTEHDNAALGDSDDDDEVDETNGGSEEEGESHTQPVWTRSSRDELELPAAPTRRPGLPTIDTTPFEIRFRSSRSPVAGPSISPTLTRREGELTPTASNAFDYFSINPQPGQSGTPRPVNLKARPSTGIRVPRSQVLPPLPPPSSRPGLYHHVSRSMINIPSLKPEMSVPKDLDRKKSLGKGKAPAEPDVTRPAPEYSEEPTLRRRRSMPVFNAASEPPPYPTFTRRDDFVILPRDDEGKERLPAYSNDIYLMALMPRKMEFSAPGVQAKDRKWRRMLCELHGTAFRVYQCPAGAAGVGVIGEWWEKKVGVGDVAVGATSASPIKDTLANTAVRERPSKLGPTQGQDFSNVSIPSGSRRSQEPNPPQSSTSSTLQKSKRLTALLHPGLRGDSSPSQSRLHLRTQSDASLPSNGDEPHESHDLWRPATHSSSQLNASFVSSSTARAPSPSGSPGSSSRSSFFRASNRNSVASHVRSTSPPAPDPADLVRVYSLQNAESGLGNDYIKRKNVIRVRMDGEQFLLQAQDVAEVVEWIEVCILCEWSDELTANHDSLVGLACCYRHCT
jgi:hypothetical protein